MKKYYTMYGVGKAKYVVNFHNGESKHKDGSEFWGIRLLNSKKAVKEFTQELKKQGYKYI